MFRVVRVLLVFFLVVALARGAGLWAQTVVGGTTTVAGCVASGTWTAGNMVLVGGTSPCTVTDGGTPPVPYVLPQAGEALGGVTLAGTVGNLASLTATGVADGGAAPTAATTTVAGLVKTNLGLVFKTTSPVSVTIGAISLLGAGIIPSVSASVPGTAVGDICVPGFAGTPVSNVGLLPSGVTAAGTVLVTPVALAALVLGSTATSLNFVCFR